MAHDRLSVATPDDAVASLQRKHPERWFTNFNIKVHENCVFRLICSLFIRVVILTTKKYTKYVKSHLQGFSLFDDQNPQLTKYCTFYRIFLPMVIPVYFSCEWERYYLQNVKHNFFKPCNNMIIFVLFKIHKIQCLEKTWDLDSHLHSCLWPWNL